MKIISFYKMVRNNINGKLNESPAAAFYFKSEILFPWGDYLERSSLLGQVSLANAQTFIPFLTVVLVMYSGLIRSTLCTKSVHYYIQWVLLLSQYLCSCCLLRRYLAWCANSTLIPTINTELYAKN